MENTMAEINLKELTKSVLSRWWIICICVLVIGSAAYAYSNYYLIPIYESYTTLYVGKNIEQSGLQAGDLYLGSALISDYREIAKSKLVASEVINELNLSHMSAGALSGRIGVAQKNDTRVIQISVSDSSPQMAMNIANKVAEVFQKKVIDIMQVENVQIIDKAELPRYPVSPNKNKNVIVGIMFGIALGLGIALLLEYLDDYIKTPDDVQTYTDLPVIGTIPMFQIKGRRV